VARSAWQRLRELTRTYGRGADQTGFIDEEPEGRNFQDTMPREDAAEEEDPHAERGSNGAALVGLGVVLALLLISSCLILATQAVVGELKLPWGNVVTWTLGLVTAICVTAFAWWAGSAWRRRKSTPTEVSPHAGRTEDDQNSVGMP
jgi:hypothetical protein